MNSASMASQVLQAQNDSESLTSDDYSYLPEVESGNIPNGDINYQGDCFNFTNMQSALSGPSSDSIVEVHSQLSELIEENHRLKEQLEKNNSMMEDQITTIQSWRDHMISSKSQLEENLKISKEKISSLEKENSELLGRIDGLIKANEEEKVNLCIQCTANKTDLNNVLAVDFGNGNDYIKHEWSYFRQNLHENLKFVYQKLEAMSGTTSSQEEKLLLECYISMLKYKVASLKGDIGQLVSLQADEESGYEIVRVKTHEDGTQQFHKVIEELKQKVKDKDKEVICLMNDKEELVVKIKECEAKMQEQEMNLKTHCELLSNKLQNESSLSQKYRERCESLQQQIEEYQFKLEQSRSMMLNDDEVKTLREEVQQLQDILKLEHQAKQVDKEKYSVLMKQCEKMQVDFDRVSDLLKIQSKEDKEKSEKLTLVENDVKKYMEEVDHLTAKLLETEEKLEESQEKVKRLESHLSQINEESENIPFLKAQIESYKIDYNNLESAKNAASDELEKLKNELKKYEKEDSTSNSARSSSRRSSDVANEGAAAAVFRCPVCEMGFTTENAAQNHIDRCLLREV